MTCRSFGFFYKDANVCDDGDLSLLLWFLSAQYYFFSFYFFSESLAYHSVSFLGDGVLFQHFNSDYAHVLKVNGKCPLRARSGILRQVLGIHQKVKESFISVKINFSHLK